MTTPSGDYGNGQEGATVSAGSFTPAPIMVGAQPTAPATIETPQTPPANAAPVAPTAQPATAAAPEAPKAPETPAVPKVESVPSTTVADGVVEYDPTGDAGLDLALDFVGRLGIAGTDPAMVAAANGDFSLLKAVLAGKGDAAKGWEQFVAVGEAAFQRQAGEFAKAQEATITKCHSICGGKEQFNAVVAWGAANADADQKAALNEMFDKGGAFAEIAIRTLVNAYQGASDTVINPAQVASYAGGSAPTANAPLTAEDYGREVHALYNKYGNNIDNLPQYHALRSRFLAGR